MNKDLGNCLDYTNSPENNLRPGEYNCNRLQTMYGTVDGAVRRFLAKTERLLRGENKKNSILDSDPSLSEEYDRAMEELRIGITYNDHNRKLDSDDQSDMMANKEWRVLKDHPRGGAFVRRLNTNIALEVHVLYPMN
jgi:hypothetical protein